MTTTTHERGFTIVRHFVAAPETVWRAWTEPAHLGWFAGPDSPRDDRPITVDLRVGGAWRIWLVEGGSGRSYTTGGIYHVIEAPRRLVFSWGAIDGWPALNPDRLDDVPLVTVALHEQDGGTTMTFDLTLSEQLTPLAVRGWFDLGILQGWSATLDKLDPHLTTRTWSTP